MHIKSLLRLASMTPSPKVSIVMPVYNGGHYFALALESALQQDYDALEIVVVDDGSDDGGEVEAIARAGDRLRPGVVRYIRQANQGVSAALNAGIGAMSGDVFCWLSHDDLHLPHKTSAQVAFWRDLGRSDAILISDYDIIDPEGAVLHEIRLDHAAAAKAPRLPLFGGWINGCTVFIPRAALEGSEPFERRWKYVQDYRLWRKLLQRHEFFHQPETLVRYRHHPGQDSHRTEAVTEGDALWTDLLNDVSEAGHAQLYGSSWRFFHENWRRLSQTPYTRAAAHARSGRDNAVERSLVSVVIPAGDSLEATTRSLASALQQDHPRIEVIVVGSISETNIGAAVGDAAARVRVIKDRRPDLSTLLSSGLHVAAGAYVSILKPGDIFLPEKISRQVEALQLSGSPLGYTASYRGSGDPEADHELVLASGADDDEEGHEAVAPRLELSTLMFHRLLIVEGLELIEEGCSPQPPVSWLRGRGHTLLALDDPLTIVRSNEGFIPQDGGPPKLRSRERFDPVAHRSPARRQARRLRCARPVALGGGAHIYRDAEIAGDELLFSTGATPWEYVAAIKLEPAPMDAPRFVELCVDGVSEDLFVMLVDSSFAQLGERRALDGSQPAHTAWFDLTGKAAHAVVIQAGDAPRASRVRLRKVVMHAD